MMRVVVEYRAVRAVLYNSTVDSIIATPSTPLEKVLGAHSAPNPPPPRQGEWRLAGAPGYRVRVDAQHPPTSS